MDEERSALERELAIVKLAIPLEDELYGRIDEICRHLATEQGFTLSGIARLLIDCQRRMASDWTEIGALRRRVKVAEVAAPARAAEWHPLEQLIARWRRIVEGLDHETQGDCISEGRRAYVDGKSRGIRHCADQLEKLLPPCALTGNSESTKK